MYFKDRKQAGQLIADKLEHYKDKQTSVVALSPGAVIVGSEIAVRLHSTLSMLLTENITLPGENVPLAAVTPDNTFTYNNKFSTGEIEEMRMEFINYIESKRLEKLHHLHYLLGHGGEIHRELLRNHIVILVSDGMPNGFSLDVAADYLKPIKMTRLIAATPIASPNAVDKMHLSSDEIVCLSVVPNYMETNHYYDNNDIPQTEELFKIVMNNPVHWNPQVLPKHHIV